MTFSDECRFQLCSRAQVGIRLPRRDHFKPSEKELHNRIVDR